MIACSPRAAEAVDVVGGGLFGNAGVDSGHSRQIGILGGRWNYVAHHDVTDALRIDLAGDECGFDCGGGQIAQRYVLERTAKGADGCAPGAQDENLGGLHGGSLLFLVGLICWIISCCEGLQSSPFAGQSALSGRLNVGASLLAGSSVLD